MTPNSPPATTPGSTPTEQHEHHLTSIGASRPEPLGLCERHRIGERHGAACARSAAAPSAAGTVRNSHPDSYPVPYSDAVRE